MKDENGKKIQFCDDNKAEKLLYEKPVLNSISAQIEVNAAVSNCSMGQNVVSIPSCDDNE